MTTIVHTTVVLSFSVSDEERKLKEMAPYVDAVLERFAGRNEYAFILQSHLEQICRTFEILYLAKTVCGQAGIEIRA